MKKTRKSIFFDEDIWEFIQKEAWKISATTGEKMTATLYIMDSINIRAFVDSNADAIFRVLQEDPRYSKHIPEFLKKNGDSKKALSEIIEAGAAQEPKKGKEITTVASVVINKDTWDKVAKKSYELSYKENESISMSEVVRRALDAYL